MWIRLNDAECAKELLEVVKKHLPADKELASRIKDAMKDNQRKSLPKLIQLAKDLYTDSAEDIEVDDDAALSVGDNGTWVMGWLWVPKP